MIRKIIASDLPGLQAVLRSIELFPEEALPEMINDYLTNPASNDIWITYLKEDEPIALAFCAPEQFTHATFNLYAIGIDAGHQGKGIGQEMMQYIEHELMKVNARILIVETSGSEEMASTRAFYLRCGYRKEAVIHDFWQEGEDKIIFWKKIGAKG